MRRAIPALLVLALAFALALPATAATPNPKQMAGQIRALQAQVKKLQKTVKTLNTAVSQTRTLAIVSLLYGACSTAATADAFAATGMAGFTAAPNPVADYQSCSDLSTVTGTTVARQPNTQTQNVFQALLNVFKP
jgi:uncharacterized membrane protein